MTLIHDKPIPLPHYNHSTWWGDIREEAISLLAEAGLSEFDEELRYGGKWNLDSHSQVLNALRHTAELLLQAAPSQPDTEGVKAVRSIASWMDSTASKNAPRASRQSAEINRAVTGPVNAKWSQVD